MKRAVCYYRHSAEDKQENSVLIQSDLVSDFARKHEIKIIGYEADEGKSGITAKRPGFKRLFEDWVCDEEKEFDYVLVLDASRWGRFQNPDEAAYHDFLCTKYGRRVVYVERGLSHNPQEELINSMIIMIDRFMAGEYSRVLGKKVWHGCVKVIEQGFSAGGSAPFGLERQLIDEQKNPIRVLELGEHKAIANQRVKLIPGKNKAIVKQIYEQYVVEGRVTADIAENFSLSAGLVRRILSNEVYAGNLVYNKTSSKLKTKRRANPVKDWVRTEGATEPIVSGYMFQCAQFIRARSRYSFM